MCGVVVCCIDWLGWKLRPVELSSDPQAILTAWMRSENKFFTSTSPIDKLITLINSSTYYNAVLYNRRVQQTFCTSLILFYQSIYLCKYVSPLIYTLCTDINWLGPIMYNTFFYHNINAFNHTRSWSHYILCTNQHLIILFTTKLCIAALPIAAAHWLYSESCILFSTLLQWLHAFTTLTDKRIM